MNILQVKNEQGEWIGIPAIQGPPGKDGTFEELTPEQKEELRGPQGTPGQNGKDGATGPQGEPGKDGEKGDRGEQGFPGKDGEPGKDGKSAYQIAVDNGFEGTEEEWLASLKGEKGADGQPGVKGDKGDNGIYVGSTEPEDPGVLVWIDLGTDTEEVSSADVYWHSFEELE